MNQNLPTPKGPRQPSLTAPPTGDRNQWHSSSRHSPCPVCGRNTDDKCRWHDSAILCHQGDSFSPPPLQPGQTLQIEGQAWACVSLSGGFSGAAMVLRPHLDRNSFRPAQQRIRKRIVTRATPRLAELFSRARRWVQAVMGMPAVDRLTVPELEQELSHARSTAQALAALRKLLIVARRENPAIGRWVQVVGIWQRLVAYQLRGLESFLRVELGTPTAEQIALLEVA